MLRLALLATTLGLAAVVVAGVDAQTKPQLPIGPRVALLEQRVSSLQGNVTRLQDELARLRGTADFLRLSLAAKQDSHDTVTLDMTSPRQFERLDTDTGFFLVSVEEVVPYLDGYKVYVDIGNPSFATYSGLVVTAKWGRSYDWSKYTDASYKKWQASIKEREVPFTQDLKAGTWNKIQLVLASTKPDEIGFLELSLKTDTVSLLKQ